LGIVSIRVSNHNGEGLCSPLILHGWDHDMNEKPKLFLTGDEGSVNFLLERVTEAAKQAGWTEDMIAYFKTEASRNYPQLLKTCIKYFEIV